eukprot:TRINITY_DN5676_c0_g1_i1.p1 TRINITY_DN5676_c0_g1~~TRINITY_DN5676_c0_g1_i1.p1  ORF type:complete len:237 (+),score=53.48 TRINITY_DN5676_c0_g1_i1:128-838(+)
METCCESLIKYFMVICNCVFALIGMVLIGFGAYVQIEAKDYVNFLGDNYVNTPIFVIILGGIIFVISFFGCCGACHESKCMMYTYGFFLFFILIAQIGAGIAAFALKGDLSDNIKTNLEKGLDNYVESEMYAKSWNLVQETFQCCGVEDYKDWQDTFNTTTKVPDSCCRVPTENCGNDFDVKDIWEMGCFESFSDLFVDNIGIVGAVAICVAVAELITVCVAYCMGKRMGSSGQYV